MIRLTFNNAERERRGSAPRWRKQQVSWSPSRMPRDCSSPLPLLFSRSARWYCTSPCPRSLTRAATTHGSSREAALLHEAIHCSSTTRLAPPNDRETEWERRERGERDTRGVNEPAAQHTSSLQVSACISSACGWTTFTGLAVERRPVGQPVESETRRYQQQRLSAMEPLPSGALLLVVSLTYSQHQVFFLWSVVLLVNHCAISTLSLTFKYQAGPFYSIYVGNLQSNI